MTETIDRLDRVLEERDRIFPERQQGNDLEMHRLLEELFGEVDDDLTPGWSSDKHLVKTANGIGDHPLFLCGYMKSGTTLLLELLDGHSEVIALPGDSFMITRVSEKERESKYSWEEWRRNWVKRMVNPTGQKPFWILGRGRAPYTTFLQYLDYYHNHLQKSWKNPVLSTVLSFFCANSNRPSKPKIWVEKTPGNEFRIDWILKLFPQARFIHIVRDPRENLASLKKLYHSRSWDWNYGEMGRTLARSCRSADINRKRLGKTRYKVLSYEKLTENPEEMMRELARFAGISWEENLLKPTVNSFPATANSMYKDRKVTGMVRQSKKDKWRQVLSEEEQRLIVRTLPDARKVGYSWDVGALDGVMMWLQRLRTRTFNQ